MRTTVEIPQRQREILHTIALKRGLRGFSQVMQEAIDFYIRKSRDVQPERQALLKLKGVWSAKTARLVRNRIFRIRKNWTI